jgi:hypothetical protein
VLGVDDPNVSEIAEVKAIVSGLPALKELSRHITSVSGYDAATRDPKAYQEARSVLDATKIGMDRLRVLVKPGSSIFHYPGLLAIGEVRYSPPLPDGNPFSGDSAPIPGLYRIYYGTVGMEMSIEFDESGRIIALKKLKRPY